MDDETPDNWPQKVTPVPGSVRCRNCYCDIVSAEGLGWRTAHGTALNCSGKIPHMPLPEMEN